MSAEDPAHAAPAVAVVIVAHSSGPLLLDCVRRTLGADAVAEVVVVDNASRDGSIEQLSFAHGADPRLIVVRNAGNPGFAHACNQGAAATVSPWLAFLNPDCLIEQTTLARLIEAAARVERPGVIGADVRDAHGAPEAAARRRDPTPWRAFARVLGSASVMASARKEGPHDGVRIVDAVSGALLLLPRATYEALGGFDAGYRLHAEDLDLCRRARGAGYTVAVAEDVAVTHLKGSSSARRPLFVEYHKHRGMWRYFSKFDGAGAPALARGAVWMAIWARFALFAPWLALKEAKARFS